jgi:ribosomal protein L11 methyltransferase
MTNPLRWTEVRVFVPRGWQELVASSMAIGPCTTVSVGNTSIEQEDPPEGFEALRTFVPSDQDTPALRERLRDSLASLAQRAGAPELESLPIRFKKLPSEDYATSWKKSWKPFRVQNLVVIPPWFEDPVRPSDCVLHLQPGGAFGSGRHATTRTCLKVLQERMRGSERVLDAGSGSGILSVSAALLGADSVLGFDIDDTGPVYGNQLARDNHVEELCTFRHGDFSVLTPNDGPFGVILANIYSDVIEAEAENLRLRLDPAGWFAFSGCPLHHAEATRVAIVEAGLCIEEERLRGRWMTFVGGVA